MAKELEKLTVAVEANSRQFERTMRSAEARTEKFGKVVKRVALTVGGLFAGRALIRGAANAVKAFGVQEQAVSDLNAALKATGRFSIEASKSIQRAATEMQQLTTVGDELLISATAALATLATALDVSQLEAAGKALVGLADVFFKGDLNAAALQLGKSIGGTTNSLARFGIQVDMSASQGERLNQILAQTAGFFEISKSRAKGTKGSFQQLANSIGDVQETFGGMILSMASGAGSIDGLRQRVEAFNRVLISTSEIIPDLVRVFVGMDTEFGKSAERVVRLEEELSRARAAVEAFNRDVELGVQLTRRQTENWIAAGLSVIALETQLKNAETTLDAYTVRTFEATAATDQLTESFTAT